MIKSNLTLNNMILTFLRTILEETILSILYFPLWWYSRGTAYAWHNYLHRLQGVKNVVALDVWIKNWLQPMYGQYDIVGRIISVGMRTVQIIFRFLITVLAFIFFSMIFVLWLIIPMIIIVIIINQVLLLLLS